MIDSGVADFPVHTPRPEGAPLALEGVRVIDFSHFLAGPVGTMILADMGADVVKIESPGRGDEFRHYPPVPEETPGQGAPYMWANRNKRSLAIDLKTPQGLELAKALIAQADIVCENFSTGVIDRLGLGYDTLKALNPRLICCSVSAYGRDGAFKDRLGFDPIAQAESGFMSLNGYPDREGVRTLSPVMDISTGMMVCNAILGALLARARTGRGQRIELALIENAVLMTGYVPLQHLYSGSAPQRHGNISPDTCPSGVFMSQDKPFYLNCGNDKIFQRLARQVLDRPDLADDPVYADRNGRMARRERLFDLMNDRFAQQPWSFWQARMREAQIPCGEVRSVGDALRSPEARERQLVTRIEHPVLGWVPNVRLPIRYSDTPLADPRPAPAVGQHTDELLAELLGYDEQGIQALRASGALG
ncbi:CoA transferase [uncultured Hydrogenophaga sp.]|uniref:CaiB/BaiF CoA transferase family protein n=1 Tax=uncultured Hydrogenophaga sp. TaxID=199683 RepID=UPI00258E965E|nr:CoA transferase [uncultured Hydrogenophaga sp.]